MNPISFWTRIRGSNDCVDGDGYRVDHDGCSHIGSMVVVDLFWWLNGTCLGNTGR